MVLGLFGLRRSAAASKNLSLMTGRRREPGNLGVLAAYGSMNSDGPPTDIFEAAQRGMHAFITKQVDRSVEFDINQRDKFNRTALHWAAEMGHLDTADVLLDYGCDVAALECNGRTAVHLAARSCDAEMIKTLLKDKEGKEKEGLVNQTDNFGITPVFLTMQKGDDGKGAFEYLMLNGARYSDKS